MAVRIGRSLLSDQRELLEPDRPKFAERRPSPSRRPSHRALARVLRPALRLGPPVRLRGFAGRWDRSTLLRRLLPAALGGRHRAHRGRTGRPGVVAAPLSGQSLRRLEGTDHRVQRRDPADHRVDRSYSCLDRLSVAVCRRSRRDHFGSSGARLRRLLPELNARSTCLNKDDPRRE
jgi:hypothetical protein